MTIIYRQWDKRQVEEEVVVGIMGDTEEAVVEAEVEAVAAEVEVVDVVVEEVEEEVEDLKSRTDITLLTNSSTP